MSDDDSERHVTAFPELSDSISVMSSTPGDNIFPDIAIVAHVGDASEEKSFKGKIDTGARLCLIAEHVVADRFGMERIDTSRWVIVDDLGKNGIRTMGRIEIFIRLGSSPKWLEVPFQVIPDSYVRYRYDALLSDKLIKRKSILVFGPDWQD
jgi:hypothetical protein